MSFDSDLNPVLKNASDVDLLPIRDCLLKKFSNFVDCDARFHNNPDRPTLYADLIADEIRLFGGNTFANFFRGGEGVSYREVVCDVADLLHVSFDENASVEEIETATLAKVFEEMPVVEKEKIIKELGLTGVPVGASATLVVQMVLKMGGFATYKFAVIIANTLSRFLIGRGLSLAANATLTKAVSVAIGPVGWGISGLWLANDLAGPSYRTTVPCVLHIAALRQKQKKSLESA